MYVVQHGYGFKLNDTCNFDWVHIEDLADVYVLLIRTILEREDRGVGYIPSGKKGVILPAVERVMHSEIMQKRLDAAFEAGVLPRADTPKEKEIRQVGLREIADEAMAGGARLSGTQRPKGTTAKELLGWKPSRLQEAWGQDFADSLKLLKEG